MTDSSAREEQFLEWERREWEERVRHAHARVDALETIHRLIPEDKSDLAVEIWLELIEGFERSEHPGCQDRPAGEETDAAAVLVRAAYFMTSSAVFDAMFAMWGDTPVVVPLPRRIGGTRGVVRWAPSSSDPRRRVAVAVLDLRLRLGVVLRAVHTTDPVIGPRLMIRIRRASLWARLVRGTTVRALEDAAARTRHASSRADLADADVREGGVAHASA